MLWSATWPAASSQQSRSFGQHRYACVKREQKKKEQGGGQGEGQDEGSTANRTDSKVSKTDTDTESGQKWTSGQATSALATTNGQGK